MLAVQQPAPAQSATAWLVQTCTWDFKTLSPSKKRIHFKELKSAIVAWMLQAFFTEFDNRLGFMAYAVAVIDAAQFAVLFPPPDVLLAAPAAPVFPAAPTTANLAQHTALLRVYTAYTKSFLDLKMAFIHFFETDIQHLRNELTQYHNVTPQQMWDAAVANHGMPHTEDIDKLRSLTLLPCDRSLTAEENVVLFLTRHKALSDQGAIYATASGQKLIEARKFLNEMAPEVQAIVDKYHADTDFPARTAEALLASVRDGLRRLPVQPILSSISSVRSAIHHDKYDFHPIKVPTAYVATAAVDEDTEPPTALAVQPSKGGGGTKKKTAKDMTLSELQTFYDSCSVAQYCFSHGYGNHQSKTCHSMKKDAKFTPAMKELTKPKYNRGTLLEVDGVLPSIVVQPGFRPPN